MSSSVLFAECSSYDELMNTDVIFSKKALYFPPSTTLPLRSSEITFVQDLAVLSQFYFDSKDLDLSFINKAEPPNLHIIAFLDQSGGISNPVVYTVLNKE